MTKYYSGEAPSLRERLLTEAHEWVRNNVPMHTRAEYEALLATNTDLALELIAKWRDLEDLRAAYRELQYEAARNVASMPVIRVFAHEDRVPHSMETIAQLRWEIDPYRANIAVSDLAGLRNTAPIIRDAFKQFFHDKYVPELWAETERTLFVAMNQKVAA